MAAPAVPTAHVTLDEFYRMDDLPDGVELADGEIIVTPIPGSDHGWLARAIFRALDAHVAAHRLGECFPDGFGYELPVPGRPDTLRVPDASFVRADRVPRPRLRNRAWALAPDLAVEVRSPSERKGVLQAKLADYLAAGTRLVWVVNATARTVEVHAPGAPARLLRAGDALDGGDVVPGFALPFAELFAALDDEG